MDAEPALAVRVRGLETRFAGQVVHAGLDLDVRRGEIFGIVGGSGAGKTVLLHTILGLRRADAGVVEIDGRAVERLGREQRRRLAREVGVTFQNGALISSLDVRENVKLPLREHLAVAERALDRVADLNIALVGLPPDAATKYPAQLSGGMVKRAALARALALEPRLLFLDEPTAGLDPVSAAAFDRLLLYLHAQLGLTVVMVTHDLDTLFGVCDRVGVIVDQRMVSGTLPQLLDSPQPWIREYFHGPRARAARKERDG